MAEPAPVPPTTLEAEVWAVQQELKAASEKLDRLSAALDELEASGEPNPGKHARLEAQFNATNATVKALTEKFSKLNQRLDEQREIEQQKRKLELSREELELLTEREARQLELKRQRIELEEQEQKQAAAAAEPRYASALEWVQATQPCKVPPPGPPDVLMPSDNTIPRIARRREMRKIWRLLRQAARKGRIPVSFLHGGPGAGKTFTAYHLMKKSDEDIAKLADKDPELYDFAQATQFVAISFNNTTPVQEGRESRWMKDYNPDSPQSRRNLFMPVTARLLYQFVNDRQLSFPSFCDSLEDAVTRNQIDASMLDLHQVIGTMLPGHDGPLVLIVDELTKLDKGNDRGIAEQMRSALCGAMNENFLVLFTSLSDEIMKKEHTASHRAVETIPLSALPEKACARLFYQELEKKTLVDSTRRQEINKRDMALAMARMCWGHPRSLEVLVSALRNAAPFERVNDVIGEAVTTIRANYASIAAYPINVLKLVLLAVNVKLNDKVQIRSDLPLVQWDDLIASGYLVNSTANTSFIPHISELMLRAIVAMYTSPEVTPPEARRLVEHLRLLLGLLGFNFDWRLFEKLNLYWELVHRDCTGMRPDLFAAISLKDYYKTPYAKGALTETLINVVDPLHTERAFPEVDGRVLVPDPNTPGLTTNVWYPGVDNFPGLDSVHFVQKADGTGILPIVFQVKFSDHGATTVLDRKTVETAYANAEKAMVEAGWTEFVFVVSAWREIAKNLLEDPPENVMILTRSTLTQQFGCLGAVVKTIHLRDVLFAPDAGDASDDDEEGEEEGAVGEQPNDEQKQAL